MPRNLPSGQRVLVSEFADNPMQAVEHHMALHPLPAPDPAHLGPDEVLVAIRSAAVSWVDLLMTSGQYQHMPRPPYCPGMEYSGTVEAVGAAVDPTRVAVGAAVDPTRVAVGAAVDPTRVAVGDRVLAGFMQVGARSSGAYRAAGGFESVRVSSIPCTHGYKV